MPKFMPIQRSFAAGELSPRMLQRADTDGYHSGAVRLENFIALAHGPIARRGGFEHVPLSEFPNLIDVKLVPFQVSQAESYVLMIQDLKTTVFTRYGGLNDDNLVVNGDFTDDLIGWTNISVPPGVAASVAGRAVLIPGGGAPAIAGIKQEITGLTITDNYVVGIQIFGGFTGSGLNVRLGTADGLGDIVDVFLQPHAYTVEITATTTSIWLEIIAPGAGDTYSVDDVSVLHEDNLDNTIEFNTPWTSADGLELIQWEKLPNENTLFLTHPNYPQQEITSASPFEWTHQDINFVSPPAEWANRNFPSSVTFHQGRSWFAGTPEQPETLWASKSGEFRDYTVTAEEADSSMVQPLDKQGSISWIRGAKDFLVGTENAEYIITADAGLIFPGDIQVVQQSAFGSNVSQGAELGNRVLYVSPDERKIRAMKYEFVDAGWLTLDLTFVSEHITEGRIKDLNYAQHPENLIWSVDRNGDLICCTFEQTNAITGWHRHSTDGEFLSICVTEEFGRSQLWAAVRRTSGENTFTGLERLDDDIYMDDFITQIFQSPVLEVDGLDHLNGKDCQVVVDGAVHADRTVEGGLITLQYPGNIVTVGLGYTSTFISMPLDADTGDGALAPLMKRHNKIYVRLLDSALPIVNGNRAPDRTPSTPMNTREPNKTTDVKIANLGHSRQAIITIEQDLPLKTVVVGIFSEVGQNRIGN